MITAKNTLAVAALLTAPLLLSSCAVNAQTNIDTSGSFVSGESSGSMDTENSKNAISPLLEVEEE